jgi:hypothetical protein
MTLQRSNAILVQSATVAAQVTTSIRLAGFLALAAGIIIALAPAFLVDSFDSRVRSTEELAEGLGLPVLGGLRESPSLRRRERLVMFDPNSASAEMFRILRSTLDANPALDVVSQP